MRFFFKFFFNIDSKKFLNFIYLFVSLFISLIISLFISLFAYTFIYLIFYLFIYLFCSQSVDFSGELQMIENEESALRRENAWMTSGNLFILFLFLFLLNLILIVFCFILANFSPI